MAGAVARANPGGTSAVWRALGVRTRAIHPSEMILVDHPGRLFYARDTGLERSGVSVIEPLDRRVSYRWAKAREVVDH
jgi:hypothetical protein